MPTGTGLTIITRSMQEAGVIGQSQVPQGNQGPNGLLTLNGMIDSWTVDDRYIFCRNIDTYALTSGQQEYLIGPSAVAPFVVPTRPEKIINANVILPSGGHMPLEIIDDDQRMDIFYPDLSASLPLKLNYKRDFPNGKLWLWFKPSAGYTLELETDKLLTEFAAIGTAYSFPPGYYEAIVYSLAERFCSAAWGGNLEVLPMLADLASKARAKIESVNLDPPPLMNVDPRCFGISRGVNGAGVTIENDVRTGRRFYR